MVHLSYKAQNMLLPVPHEDHGGCGGDENGSDISRQAHNGSICKDEPTINCLSGYNCKRLQVNRTGKIGVMSLKRVAFRSQQVCT